MLHAAGEHVTRGGERGDRLSRTEDGRLDTLQSPATCRPESAACAPCCVCLRYRTMVPDALPVMPEAEASARTW